jgi:Flp pilus assembly protein TadD
MEGFHTVNTIRLTGILVMAAAVFGACALSGCRESGSMTSGELALQAYELAKSGNWKKAGTFSAKAVKQSPTDPDVRILNSIILDHNALPALALDEAREAVKLNPKSALAHYQVGKILYDGKRYAECLDSLKRSNLLEPGNADVLILLAQACRELGNPEATRYFAFLTKLEQTAKDPAPYNELAVVFMRSNDLKKSEIFFSLASKADPENPTVALNTAVFFDQKLRKPSEAAKFYRRYLELTSGNPAAEPKRIKVQSRLKALGV